MALAGSLFGRFSGGGLSATLISQSPGLQTLFGKLVSQTLSRSSAPCQQVGVVRQAVVLSSDEQRKTKAAFRRQPPFEMCIHKKQVGIVTNDEVPHAM